MGRRLITTTLVGLLLASTAAAKDNSDNEHYSDTWLEAKLVTTMAFNRHLSVFDIDTDVEDQVVYLSGTVESDVSKDLAGEVAQSIEGVKEVRNNLKVDRALNNRAQSERDQSDRSFAQVVDDLTTTASIKSQYLANQNISGLDINVDTMNGRVSLKGKVESDAQRDLAVQIAKNTSGVREVKNNLAVQ